MKKILFFVLFCVTTSVWAQNDVTLVVSGEGKDKNEATLNALRSAIEQTYGTFVSANTTILDDKLVADEVVSLSSGNIRKYEYVTEEKLPNGSTYVTLSAQVAVSNLVSYAKSKGSECEFAGATFGTNVKMYKLYLESSRKVLNNLRLQCIELAPFLYDYQLEVGEPQINGTVEFTVKVLANENTKNFGNLIVSTLEALEFDSNYAKQLEAMGVKTEEVNFCTIKVEEKGNIVVVYIPALKKMYREDHIGEYFYRELDKELFKHKYLPLELFDNALWRNNLSSGYGRVDFNKMIFDSGSEFFNVFLCLQILSYGNFVIRDNLNNEYNILDPNRDGVDWEYNEIVYYNRDVSYETRNIINILNQTTSRLFWGSHDRGIYSISCKLLSINDYRGKNLNFRFFNTDYEKGEQCSEVKLRFHIPLERLMNITKFTVERKNDKFVREKK